MNDCKQELWSVCLAEDLMKKFPSAEQYPYKSWSYPQGYLLMGMSHVYEKTGEKKYFDYIYEYGDRHVTKEGREHQRGSTRCSAAQPAISVPSSATRRHSGVWEASQAA